MTKSVCDQKNNSKQSQIIKDIHEMIFWARRYCDGRRTYAASSFNESYDRLLLVFPMLAEADGPRDPTLTCDGKFHPYATDGDYEIFGRINEH